MVEAFAAKLAAIPAQGAKADDASRLEFTGSDPPRRRRSDKECRSFFPNRVAFATATTSDT